VQCLNERLQVPDMCLLQQQPHLPCYLLLHLATLPLTTEWAPTAISLRGLHAELLQLEDVSFPSSINHASLIPHLQLNGLSWQLHNEPEVV
jgi:hypothetical protein